MSRYNTLLTCKLLIELLLLLTLDTASARSRSAFVVQDSKVSPIIGVLSQEVYSDGLIAKNFSNKTSYIAASYVKYVEGAGARVVPIWIGHNQSYYEQLMLSINGVLLPGGSTWFNQSAGYADAGEHIINIAMRLNDQGIHMPIWGTCLGMELLIYKMANGSEARTDCSSIAQPAPLEFHPNYNESRLFANLNEELYNTMAKENVTINSHRFCYTQKTFAEMQLNNSWRYMTLNHDWDGIEFISSVEHRKYPFYGVQFHPEKTLYEFNPKGAIPHTLAAIEVSQYFANFFINETRLNTQKFKNDTEQARALIYNYSPAYTAPLGSAFVQQYLFSDGDAGIFDGDDSDDDDQPTFIPGEIIGNHGGGGGGGASEITSTFWLSTICLCLSAALLNMQ